MCIDLWKDSIPTINLTIENEGVKELANWMESKELIKVVDISQCDHDGQWIGWKYLNIPLNPIPHCLTLHKALKGFAPIATSRLDSRVWKGSKNNTYIVNMGYETLIQNSQHPTPDRIWERIWNKDGILKINLFCWEMVHVKILTIENLKKRNI